MYFVLNVKILSQFLNYCHWDVKFKNQATSDLDQTYHHLHTHTQNLHTHTQNQQNHELSNKVIANRLANNRVTKEQLRLGATLNT